MKRIFSRLFFFQIIPVIAVLYFVLLVPPAFADMKMVDDNELSQANASVTGASVKDQSDGVGKGAVSLGGLLASLEGLQASGTTLDKDKLNAVISSLVNKYLQGIGLGGFNIGGLNAFQSYSSGVNVNITGGSALIKLH